MFSVAIVGPDGAGKTTITRRLQEVLPLPMRTIYMGINTEASNVRLPLSGVVDRWKQSRERRATAGGTGRRGKSRIRGALRLAYRISEESYRQLISWIYQRRGYVVVYDRYFSFDFAYEPIERQLSWSERAHRRWLNRFYAEPDLVIFLDAPAEVLFARKGEGTLESLEARRQAFMRKGAEFPSFVTVDATKDLECVVEAVVRAICDFRVARMGGVATAVAAR